MDSRRMHPQLITADQLVGLPLIGDTPEIAALASEVAPGNGTGWQAEKTRQCCPLGI